MLCLMHENDSRRGFLPFDEAQLARMTGDSLAGTRRDLAELERNNVFSRDDDGVIFCRRMVRDEDLRQRRAAGGTQGAEFGVRGKRFGVTGGRPKTGVATIDKGGKKPPLEPPLEPPPSAGRAIAHSASAKPSSASAAAAPAEDHEMPPMPPTLRAMPGSNGPGRSVHDLPPSELLEHFRESGLAIDEAGVLLLWQECRQVDREAAWHEIAMLCAQKGQQIREGKIRNPIGLFVTTIPALFAGGGCTALREYRARIAKTGGDAA